MSRTKNTKFNFKAVIENVKSEAPAHSSEEAYRRSARELSPIDPERLLALVLAVGHSSPKPPDWAVHECSRVSEEVQSYVDMDECKLLGYKPEDAELMRKVGLNYVTRLRDAEGAPKVPLRPAILESLSPDDPELENHVRRVYRIWERNTTERNGRLWNRWIARGYVDIDGEVKETESFGLPHPPSEEVYASSLRKLSPLDLERLLALVLAVGRSPLEPSDWALRECSRVANEVRTFLKQDKRQLLGQKPEDAELMIDVGVNYASMHRDPNRTSKVSLRAAILPALDRDDPNRERHEQRARRIWNRNTRIRNGRPWNEWIAIGHDYLDLKDALEKLGLTETEGDTASPAV